MTITSSEFKKKLRSIAQVIRKYKDTHDGYVPYDIFMNILKLTAQHCCFELILLDKKDKKPILLLREDSKEKEWAGKLHIPGITLTHTMKGSEMLSRLIDKEITDDEVFNKAILKNAMFLGHSRQYQPERQNIIADTPTVIAEVDFQEIKSKLKGKWVKISGKEKYEIIPQHKVVLKWLAMGKKRPLICDTREV